MSAHEPSAGEREGLAPRKNEPSAGEREGLAPRKNEPSAGEREELAPRTKPEVPDIKVKKLFRKTTFGVFMLFGAIGLSTSILNVYTVDTHLSEEYISNSKGIAKTIADASVDILLNRDLAALQSLIDQFLEIQGIRYIYIANESGEFIAHTFVPGIPQEILESDPLGTETVERTLPGLGDFVEVGSPILAGVAGTVHVGMDQGLIALKIQRAIGQQMWLFVVVGAIGVVAAIWLVNLAANPMARLMAYAVSLARDDEPANPELLDRNDEVGHLARLFRHFASQRSSGAS